MLSQSGSPNDKRRVNDMVSLRDDLSPFLVQLTRDYRDKTATENLTSIIKEKIIRFGDPISAARFCYDWDKMSYEIMRKFFTAVSFTETPLGEIHSYLEIDKIGIEFQPYGLVFLKTKCVDKGVSPVLYFNNVRGDKDRVMHALCSLVESDASSAAQILPYVSFFGKFLKPSGMSHFDQRAMDYTWEREWRYTSDEREGFVFTGDDVFIGICPHDKIRDFERQFAPLQFIDPRRNLKRYAEKLLKETKRTGVKSSVI
jgi:hypothetical protein